MHFLLVRFCGSVRLVNLNSPPLPVWPGVGQVGPGVAPSVGVGRTGRSGSGFCLGERGVCIVLGTWCGVVLGVCVTDFHEFLAGAGLLTSTLPSPRSLHHQELPKKNVSSGRRRNHTLCGFGVVRVFLFNPKVGVQGFRV